MMSLSKPRLLVLLLVLSLAIACGKNESTDSTTGTTPQTTNSPRLDVEPFKKLARETSCADVKNRLFVIDDRLVFWDRESRCADAAYARTLYDRKPETVLCHLMDSIAGPQRSCSGGELFTIMFDTILDNLDKPDLGLGPEHTVVPVTL